MPATKNTLPTRVTLWIDRWIAAENLPATVRVEPLAGDGSTRCFFRIHFPKETRILLSDPEWVFSKDYAPHQAYLAQCHIPVPRFETVDAKAGFLVMEDLGDQLLQFQILSHAQDRMQWLHRATRLLAELHGSTFPVPPELPVSTRSFDRQKYFEELGFTEKHLIQGLLQLPGFTPQTHKKIEAFCSEIAAIGPAVFAHRDYHTRNLLVEGTHLFMIDFQDARLGPPHYDLASLLFDAYVPVSVAEQAELSEAYKNALQDYPLHSQVDWANFERDLRRVAFQRVVKAAGSFASFYTRFGKTTHLPYLVPALRSAESLVPSLPTEFADAFPVSQWLKKAENLKP